MTVNVVQNKAELSSRMKKFFSPSSERAEVLDEIKDLFVEGEVFAFGGVPRDVALYGVDQFSSDIDLVYLGDKEYFSSSISNKASKNRFGGYRFRKGIWDVDIWHAEDTWAFRSKKVKYRNVKSLLDTTITNWDSILYSLYDGRVICKPNYFSDLTAGYLDVVLWDNPNILGAIVRILRCFILKEAYQFSPKAIALLADFLMTTSNSELTQQEKKSYARCYLTDALCNHLRESMVINRESMQPLKLEKYNSSFNVTKDMFRLRY